MKAVCCFVTIAGLFMSVPAMAQQVYTNGTGGGATNIWSSAQGSSDSYGNANGFGTSSSGAMALGGGHGSLGTGFSVGGGMTAATTSSYAGAGTSGNGYVQVQTSGYAGGTVSGFAGRH
jgi:hypothetical protein